MYVFLFLLSLLCLGCGSPEAQESDSTVGQRKNREPLFSAVTLQIDQNQFELESNASHFYKSDLFLISSTQMNETHSPQLHLGIKEPGVHKMYCTPGVPQGSSWREYQIENQQLRLQVVDFRETVEQLVPGAKFRFSCWAAQADKILFSSVELNLGLQQKGRIEERGANGRIVLSNPTRSRFIVACQQNQNAAPRERFTPLGVMESQEQLVANCRSRIAWLSVPARCETLTNNSESLRQCWQQLSDQDVQWIQVEVVGGQ